VAVQTDNNRIVGRKAPWNTERRNSATVAFGLDQDTLQSSSVAMSAETEPAFLGSALDADERRHVSFISNNSVKSNSAIQPKSKDLTDRFSTGARQSRDSSSKQIVISGGRSQKVAVPSNTSSINSLFSSRTSRDDLSVTAASMSAKPGRSFISKNTTKRDIDGTLNEMGGTNIVTAPSSGKQLTPFTLPRKMGSRKGRAYHNYAQENKTENHNEGIPLQHQIDLSKIGEAENSIVAQDSNGNMSARSRLSLSSK